MFEPNLGQTDSGVKFVARGAGYSLFLTNEGAVMALRAGHDSRCETISMKLAGANPGTTLSGDDLLPGKSNYFMGNDPSRWHSNVPQFGRVRYENVYPGINLLFYGNQGHLEYDFRIAPGADASLAQLEFDNSKQLDLSDGRLTAKGEAGRVSFESLRVYQEIDGREQPVDGRFVLLTSNRVGFEIGPYDHARELIIDPILSGGYSTYFGGSGDETSPFIAVDNVGAVYIAGSTTSPANSFPQPAGSFTLFGTNPHVFVAKLDTGGQSVQYLTFLGGGGADTAAGIGVDGAGNAYVVGNTASGIGGSAAFPTTGTNAYQTAPAPGSTGTSHVFVSVLDPNGSITSKYSSYLSGNGTDVATGMTKDNRGNVYVTGTTTSTDKSGASVSDQFPASSPPQAQPFQTFSLATNQFFVTKVNTAAFGIGSISYSTYFGGAVPSNGTATGGGVAVDSTGNIYLTGTTNFIYTGTSPTTDFPILNAYQACLDVPTPNTIVGPVTCSSTSATNSDGFIAKLNPNAAAGSQLVWSTYLGGSQVDSNNAIALDSGAANVYVVGTTNSSDFTIPTASASYQQCLDTPINPVAPAICPTIASPAPTDAFVARLTNPASGNMSLTYFSYLGGSADEQGLAIAVDTASGALITGSTQSSDLCTGSNGCVIQGNLNGSQDAFFARLNTAATTGQSGIGSFVSYFGGSGVDRGTSITLDNSLSTYFAGDTTSPDLQTATPLQPQNNGGSDAFVAKLVTAADLGITGVLSLATGQTYVSAGVPATFNYTVTNHGPDLANNITVTVDLTGVPLTFVSSSGCSQTSGNTTVVCAVAPLQSGATATVSITLTPTTPGSYNGGKVSVSSANNNDPVASNNSVLVPINVSDFTVDINPKSLSIPAAGDTATYVVSVAPVPVSSTNVSFSVSGLPSASGFSFTPPSVSLSSGPATSTLSITTTARPIPIASSRSGRGVLYAIWLAVPGIALFGLGAGGSRRRKILGVLLPVLLIGLVLLQPACSSGAKTPPIVSGTPAGTYTLTLTATGGISHNGTFTLTVP
jgi:hypothetical protein